MSATHRYEVWSQGVVIAKYKTLGQALLGAVWRSRKLERRVFVWAAGRTGTFIAEVRGRGRAVRVGLAFDPDL